MLDVLVPSNSNSWQVGGEGGLPQSCLLLTQPLSSPAWPWPLPLTGEPAPLPAPPLPPHPGKDKGGRELDAVLGEHHQAPLGLIGEQAAPVDTQAAVGGVGGHQQHRRGPQAAPHVVQCGVGAHRPDMKEVLGGPLQVGDNLERHLEDGVVQGQENGVREGHRAQEMLEVGAGDLGDAGDRVGPPRLGQEPFGWELRGPRCRRSSGARERGARTAPTLGKTTPMWPAPRSLGAEPGSSPHPSLLQDPGLPLRSRLSPDGPPPPAGHAGLQPGGD